MIPIFIPSKGRAPQLRLLFESLHRNAPGMFEPTVLLPMFFEGFQTPFTAQLEQDLEQQAYKKLANEDFVKEMGVKWWFEDRCEFGDKEWAHGNGFVRNWYNFLESNWDRHIGFFMDDCIMYRKVNIPFGDISPFFTANTWCLSLRLGLNTIYHDFRTKERQKDIEVCFENKQRETSGPGTCVPLQDTFIYWKFKEHDTFKNYGFHFSWDGVFYRSQSLLDICNNTNFTETNNQHAIVPQRIENFFMNRRDMVQQDYMCAPEHSAVVCMEWNSTHPYHNCGENHGKSMYGLNYEYVNNDMVIDLDSIDFSNIQSCHDELPFKLRKR